MRSGRHVCLSSRPSVTEVEHVKNVIFGRFEEEYEIISHLGQFRAMFANVYDV